MLDQALKYAAAHHETQLRELTDWLAIPSISAQPEAHGHDIRQAAQWLVNRFKAAGMPRAELMPTDGNPVVYAEWHGAAGAPTVLVYGHYDVQPPDPLDEWHTQPFQPEVRNGNLYARGSADDKGQVYIHVKAAEAYLKGAGSLPVNLKFFVEGEEEVGSEHLSDWLVGNLDLLKSDVALISDSHMLAEDIPTIVYGLRGLTYLEIEVQSADHDLHSGSYGGGIHNPIQVLCELLAGLKDAHGHITVPGFYDKVRNLSEEERAELKRVPFNEREFLNEVGVTQSWGEEGFTVLERISARPTLEINGIWGGYTGVGQKTVLPARAAAKVSMRLVADQDAHEIAALVEDHLCKAAPATVRIVVRKLAANPAAQVERDTPQMAAAVKAYQSVFNARPVFMREGGSIPIVSDIQSRLNIPVILMGFGLPDDNLHAPNEKFNLNQFYRGIRTSIHFLNNLANSS